MSHTPGPWEMDDEASVCANNDLVAYTPLTNDWDTRFANAQLIAAAPDLLAAAMAVNRCGNGGARLSREASDMVRAAIRKATAVGGRA